MKLSSALHPRRLVLVGAALLVVVLFALWTTSSGDYLYVPNEAQPVADKIEVTGEHDPADAGGIYFIDVRVRKARWLEQLLPFVRPDGATIVPGHAVTPPGQTFTQWRLQARMDMERSEQIAAAVAFREAGLDVDATPRGALIEAVAIDVPAAKTLQGGDVIVEADGRPVLTPGGLVAAIGTISPGEKVTLGIRPRNLEIVHEPVDDGLSSHVDLVEPMGAETLAHLNDGSHDIRVVAGWRTPIREGERVHVRWLPRQTHVFDSAGRAMRT